VCNVYSRYARASPFQACCFKRISEIIEALGDATHECAHCQDTRRHDAAKRRKYAKRIASVKLPVPSPATKTRIGRNTTLLAASSTSSGGRIGFAVAAAQSAVASPGRAGLATAASRSLGAAPAPASAAPPAARIGLSLVPGLHVWLAAGLPPALSAPQLLVPPLGLVLGAPVLVVGLGALRRGRRFDPPSTPPSQKYKTRV